MKEDEIIESSFVSKTIERAQEKVEKNNFEIRKHLLEYDDVLNQQRKVVYGFRRSILEGEDAIYTLIRDQIDGVVQDLIATKAQGRALSQEVVQDIFNDLHALTGLPVAEIEAAGINTASYELLVSDTINFLLEKYQLYRSRDDKGIIQQAEKWLMLETIDTAWKQHMLNLDHLKEGIGLRGWGQKNPLIEYKREAFDIFKEMMDYIRRDVVHHIFHINIERFDARAFESKRQREMEEMNLVAGQVPSANEDAVISNPAQQQHRSENQVGRNDPCPCGSGKKYKKCHGK